MAPTRKLRSPRVREPRGELRMTPRRLDVLEALRRHRLLHSGHFLALFKSQRVLRDLRELYHHGHLDWPRAQVALAAVVRYERGGSLPHVYALSDRGAAALSQWRGAPRRAGLSAKNAALKPWTIPHELLVADVLIAFKTTCRKRGGVRLLEAEELLARAPAATRRKPKPFRLETDLEPNGARAAVEPDAAFALSFSEREEPRLLFLEADRGTEPVARTASTDLSDVARKLAAYHAFAGRGGHAAAFGISNFRVLTVTTSPARADNLIALARRVGGRGLGRFLFTDRETLARHGDDALALPWINGRGERVTLG